MTSRAAETAQVDTSEFDAAVRLGGSRCRFQSLPSQLPAKKREQLAAAMGNCYSAATIATVLKAWGHPVSAYAIGRHRRGDCSCGDKS